MPAELITVHNLSKIYRKRTGPFLKRFIKPDWEEVKAVNNISVSVKAGEAVAFLGPNGAGKTTTTKMLTGLIYPSHGDIKVLGFTPFDRKRQFLCSIGLVMGNKAGLNWDLTARQSFSLIRQMYELDAAAFQSSLKRYSHILSVEHKLDVQVRRLSLGERMKLELIGAILHEPQILFLDEPTIGLDIESKQTLRSFLKKLHKEQGVTLLLTSHDMDDVEAVCERVIVINHGQLMHDGSMDDLASHYRKERYIRLQLNAPADKKFIARLGRVVESNQDATNFLLAVKRADLPHVLSELPSKTQLLDITIETTPLEEIVGDLYQKTAAT